MEGIPVHEWTLIDAARAVRDKEISSRELTRALLSRIERLNPKINSYITVLPEHAMRDAAARDEELSRGRVRGPLHGVPVGLKDIFCTKGIRTTCGSRILSDFDPLYDATVTGKIRDAGVILLGKQNMDEFAMGSSTETSWFGPTLNPWGTDRIPGGSSGGTAASVAAGVCFTGGGADTGGSIRQPASLCGVVGMKPTYGRVSRYGMIAFASSLDQGGPIARTVPDAAVVLATYYLIAPAEASSNLARYDGVRYGYRTDGAKGLTEMMSRTRAEGFGAEVKRRIMIGTYALSAGYYEAYYGKAQKVRTLLRRDFAEAFAKVDVILTPTSPTPAFRIGEKLDDPLTMYLSDIYTIPCNLAGIPGVSVPCGLSPDGLPIGAQLLGRHFD